MTSKTQHPMHVFLDEWKLRKPEDVSMKEWLLMGYMHWCTKDLRPEYHVRIAG